MELFPRKRLSKNILTLMISALDVISLPLLSTAGRWDPSVLLPLHTVEMKSLQP